jgi:hypothetical protein
LFFGPENGIKCLVLAIIWLFDNIWFKIDLASCFKELILEGILVDKKAKIMYI